VGYWVVRQEHRLLVVVVVVNIENGFFWHPK
jgi:hypothetical protein